jgi:TRAP transporter TAXI family solute receptor
MKYCNLKLVFFVSILFYGNSFADEEIGMVTGSKTGTYMKVGKDIAEISIKNGVNILVKVSSGSVDNIKRMNSKENAAFGIVQSDVLGHLKKSGPKSQKIAKRLRMVAPLYNEEIHIFAQKSIHSLSDLDGKRVSVGSSGGGSWLTAGNLFRIKDITPREVLNFDKFKAASKVLTGEIDAMVYVVGKPAGFFLEKIGKLASDNRYSKYFDNVHFVPIRDEDVLKEYVVGSIGSNDYPWIKGPKIATAAVKAMMVSYDFSSRATPYYRKRCDQLGIIGKALRANIANLKSNGRTEKWKEVDLNASVGRWKADKCSRIANGAKTGSVSSMLESLLRE